MQKTGIVLLFVLCGIAAGQPKELPLRPPGASFRLRDTDHEEQASFRRRQPVVGTTYFYWYDVESKGHIVDHDGTDALTTHPADMDGISYKRARWHKTQLEDMIDAGIDFLMPVYWGVPGDYDSWSFIGLPPLVEAHTALQKAGLRPPAIGMFYDTSILRHNRFNADGGNYHVDLSTDFGRKWFYTPIRDFWSLIPPSKWARINGKPIIFLYASAFAKGQDPERQFAYVRNRFAGDFAIEPFIVKSSGWKGEADAVYAWGGAVSGPIIFRDVVALGPGYDHSAVPGRQPLIVDRKDGRTYIDRWTQVLQLDPKLRAWMVHVETWNEWHEGTDVAHSREYGRSYIVLTKLFADMWHAGTHLRLPSGYANAKGVSWEPDAAGGLSLRPSSGDGVWEPRTIDDVRAVVSASNPHSQTGRYLYFNVDDAFAFGLVGRSVIVRITYRDAGCTSFGVEYDSTVDEGPLDGAFRAAGNVAIAESEEWKTVELTLPDCRFMNRCNGTDLRVTIVGGDLELAVSRVELEKAGQEAAGPAHGTCDTRTESASILRREQHLDRHGITDDLNSFKQKGDLDGVPAGRQMRLYLFGQGDFEIGEFHAGRQGPHFALRRRRSRPSVPPAVDGDPIQRHRLGNDIGQYTLAPVAQVKLERRRLAGMPRAP